MYLVEGLARGRTAVLTKTHQAMVDGISAIDIGQVILDVSPEPRVAAEELWMPRNEPTDVELICDAVAEAIARPGEVVDNVRAAAGDAVATVGKIAGQVLSMARTASRGAAPDTPLNVSISAQRRFAIARTQLEDYRKIRSAHGCSVNDVVLSVVAGALRSWLLSRGEPVTSSSSVRAMVPMSVRGQADVPSSTTTGSLGNRVSSFLVDLPVGEPSPVVRLHQVTHSMRERTAGMQHVGADTLVRIGGFAPPTLHALGRPRGQRLLQAHLQPGGHERAGPAVPALRGRCAHAGAVPRGAAGQGTGPGDRPHQLRRRRLLRSQRRPRRDARRRRAGGHGARVARRTAGDGHMTMRVYVPATWPMLRTLVKSGELDPIGGTAFALTPRLREHYTSGDDEELEYAAMNEAARASLRLLSVELCLDEEGTPARRVVVAADLEDVTLRPDLDDGAVRIAGSVPLEKVAAVHIDDEDAEYAVRQASEAVDAADMGDLDAEFLIGEAEDHELAWYDPSEIAHLVNR